MHSTTFYQHLKTICLVNNSKSERMHCDQTINSSLPISAIANNMHVVFKELQQRPVQTKLAEVLTEKNSLKEFHYGIELMARTGQNSKPILDYNRFGSLLPVFTSIVWLGQLYSQIQQIDEVPAIKLAKKLKSQTLVLPHFSCYQLDRKRIQNMLALNFTNILAVLGDVVENGQIFEHTVDLINELRREAKDSISIGVAGYPDGHPDANTLEEDMNFLVQKIDAGADFVITQMCFSNEAILNFLKKCRSKNITVPIIVGIYVPDSLSSLQRVAKIAKVQVPPTEFRKYEALAYNPAAFIEHAIQAAVETIHLILNSDLNVYGVQFYTMNKFDHIKNILDGVSKNFIKNTV